MLNYNEISEIIDDAIFGIDITDDCKKSIENFSLDIKNRFQYEISKKNIEIDKQYQYWEKKLKKIKKDNDIIQESFRRR